MNLKALKEINTNNPEIIENLAEEKRCSPQAAIGIALQAVDQGYSSLTGRQIPIFEKAILPLIKDVQCTGYSINPEEDPNECEILIKDDELEECYINEEFYCEICAEEKSFHAHQLDKIMND